jgi:NADH:ubiquinone oxidoreductase subunit B-like Fe-S oxidoreductase
MLPGVFAQSYASEGGIGSVLPVDLWIPDCPPRPEAIINGLLTLMGRLPEATQDTRRTIPFTADTTADLGFSAGDSSFGGEA